MASEHIEQLLTRRSVLARNMTGPGPDAGDLEKILRAATRVPDHGKIAPWRFVLLREQARQDMGKVLRTAYLDEEPDASPAKLDLESQRFERAPLVITVISSPVRPHKVPDWEQVLSCGAVCQNILHAANALGYASQWITEWYAYHPDVIAALGVNAHEKIAGFIYLGTATEAPKERPRPELEQLITDWSEPSA